MSGLELARPPGAPGAPPVRFTPYVPRVLLRHLAESPEARVQVAEGTLVFADVSGFTRMSERLARKGREGAEQLSDTISECFSALLELPYDNGGSLIKFGGDAMLLLFEGQGHALRACHSAAGMRRLLHRVGRIRLDSGGVRLSMSVGVHSGPVHLFLVGESHREHVIAGPAATEVVRMENTAGTGEIVVSPATVRQLPASSVGRRKGGGVLLTRTPSPGPVPAEPRWRVPDEEVAGCLSTALRRHVRAGLLSSEHRIASVAFVHFSGIDAVIEREGPEPAADAVEEIVTDVQRAMDEHQVSFLASDVDIDGGKLMLASGAPRALGDDEERMLLALRRVVERERRLPVQIGVASGTVFAGDVGPHYRLTYTAMGDTTNLAARLMARAPASAIYANARIVEATRLPFDNTALEPFMVKGKRRPVQAWSVGRVSERASLAPDRRDGVRLVGRDRERALLEETLAAARAGSGRLIELSGEAGGGKSRLLEELRELARDTRVLRVRCDSYRAATPYSAWRQLLRQQLGLTWDDSDTRTIARLRARVRGVDPALLPWLPLIALALDVDIAPTPEMEAIAPEFRSTALHEVLLTFLSGELDSPTVLEIEDAHLMDEASGALLQAVVRALPERPWLVAVARRAGEGGFAANPADHVTRVALEPLEPGDALELARAMTDRFPLPPHLLDAAVARSGGNPQYLFDLLEAAARGGAEALPDSVEAAAMTSIDSLAAADRDLVRRAAVLGVRFHPRHLADVLNATALPGPDTWRRLDAVFEPADDDELQFRRGVVHEAAYAGLPFKLRRELHLAVGEHLEREAAPRSEELAGPLSLHFLLAGDDARAWRYARLAGDRASARFAWADAARQYRRALDAARRLELSKSELVDVWESLGEAQARTGELSAATSAYTAARRLAARDRLREAQLVYLHTLLSERAGRITATVRWARRGLRMLEDLDGRPAVACRARLLAALATARQRQGRHEDAIALCERAISEAEASREEAALAHACYILDWALFDSGRGAEAIHSERALAIYDRLGDLDRQAAVLNNLGAFAYHEGRWDEAVALYERAAEASSRAGDVVNAAFGDCNVAEVRSDQGRLVEAEEALRRALLVWRGTDHQSGVAFATAQLGRTLARGGRVGEGLGLLERALALSGELRVDAYSAFIDPLVAEALAFAERADAAREAAERLLANGYEPRMEPLLERVRGFALTQLGRPAEAQEAFERALLVARERKLEYEVACSLHALGSLAPDAAFEAAERDAIMARLNVVALHQPPLGRVRARH